MRLVGRGHEAIRASHDKTLEFTPDGDITARATCVVAVGTSGADDAMAGPVRVTITAGDEQFAFDALANSAWRPGDPAVVRRSAARLPGTLATEATASAADLPAALVARLRDPGTTVEVVLEPTPSPATAVLFLLDPSRPDDPRLRAEVAAADTVVAEDDAAARLVGRRVATGAVPVSGRTLVVATADLPGTSVAHQLAAVELDVLGLPPALAAAAASPSRRPLVVATGDDPREALRRTPATHRLVVATDAEDVSALLELATRERGVTGAVVVGSHARPRRSTAGVRGRVHLCFDASTESTALDPAVREAVRRLIADGVPTKAAASTLATLTGWDRRRAYDTVLSWRDE